jgi:hypothetical protein
MTRAVGKKTTLLVGTGGIKETLCEARSETPREQ